MYILKVLRSAEYSMISCDGIALCCERQEESENRMIRKIKTRDSHLFQQAPTLLYLPAKKA